MPVYPAIASNTNCATPGCWCRDRLARYPSDLTDAQWELLRPQAEHVMAELRQAAGRPMIHDLRAMLDALFYVVRNGIEWRALPADFPPGPRCMPSTSAGTPAACRSGWCTGYATGCGYVLAGMPSPARRSWTRSR
jgi:transposase